MSRRRSLALLPAAALATTLIASPAAAQDPEELVIGFVPSVEAGALVEDIEPLAEFLSETLGVPVEGFVSSDYTALVTAMQTGQAHIGALPPFGLVQAVDIAGAEMILQSERFGSPSYHTQFITNNPEKYCLTEVVENERREGDEMITYLNCNGTERAFDESPIGPVAIEEAVSLVEAGTAVSFTEPTSSSGFIFPATIFATLGVDAENDLEAVFAGGHTASVIAVCLGQAEVGVSYDDARSDAETACDVPGTVVTFAYGPEIPNDGMAVAGDLSEELKANIKQAMLDYAATEEGAAVLDSIYNINAFAEPNLESLQIIRDAVAELGYGS